MKDRRPMRVLLLHEGWEAALYLTVELARLGVRVTLAGSSEPSLLRRYAEAVRAVDIRSAPGREGLSQLMSSTPWDAVIATTEELLFAVFESRAVPIEKIWPRLDPKFLPILRDRRLVDQFVRSLDVRMPRLIVVGERSLSEAVEEIGLPCIVRGTTGRAGNQIRLASDIASAEAAFAALAEISPGQPFLQEYVTGRTILVGGLFDEGESRQWFVAEKVDVHPTPFGPSIRSRSIHMPEAIDLSARIFAPTRFHGLGFAEFIVPPDGPPVFVEINPRQWGSIRAACSAGLDFLACAAKQIAGHIPDPSRTYPAGRDASLFPQYLAALISRQRVSRHDVLHIARALQAIPWRDPVLAAHFFRELNWHRHAIGRVAIACGQQGPDVRFG